MFASVINTEIDTILILTESFLLILNHIYTHPVHQNICATVFFPSKPTNENF
jgi:hypothetical protein